MDKNYNTELNDLVNTVSKTKMINSVQIEMLKNLADIATSILTKEECIKISIIYNNAVQRNLKEEIKL